MKKKKITSRTKKKIVKFLIPVAGVLGLFITIYMAVVSPTKKDIRRIESLVKNRSGQSQANTPVWIPEGNVKIEKTELDKLERDIEKIESSIFFSLSSETYLQISMFYFDQANFKKAAAYVDKSIKKSPLNIKSLLLRSILHLCSGSLSEALSDISVVLDNSPDYRTKSSALVIKSILCLLSGDFQNAKELLIESASLLILPGESKEVLLFAYYFLSNVCMNLGEYDSGDYYFSRAKDVAKQIEGLNNADQSVFFVLALVNFEGDTRKLIDNYDNLVKINDGSFFNELLLHFYRAAMSINNFEAFSAYLEKAIQFCVNNDMVFFQQIFKEMLFGSCLNIKNSFRKDLWDDIINSPARIPVLEPEMYQMAGDFYHEQKDNETALNSLIIALERYSSFGAKKDIIDTKINLYHIQFDLKDFYSSAKTLRSALIDINQVLRNSKKDSYLSKRATEEVNQLKAQKEGILDLLPTIDKFFR
jgi:tetratricopeptide (TPR) repeat protein